MSKGSGSSGGSQGSGSKGGGATGGGRGQGNGGGWQNGTGKPSGGWVQQRTRWRWQQIGLALV